MDVIKAHSVKDFNEPQPRVRGTAARINAYGMGLGRKITIWNGKHVSIFKGKRLLENKGFV
jgi:hypothetical protein